MSSISFQSMNSEIQYVSELLSVKLALSLSFEHEPNSNDKDAKIRKIFQPVRLKQAEGLMST